MRQPLFVLLLCLALSLAQHAQAAPEATYQSIAAKEFAQRIAATPNAQLIDIRTPAEYHNGHIQGARNIDFYSDAFASRMDSLNKNQPVFIYCRSGSRSTKAAHSLVRRGFGQVYELHGGIAAASWLLPK